MQTEEKLFNPFKYYNMSSLYETTYIITNDVPIIEDTLPGAYRIEFTNLTHKISPNVLNNIYEITFYKYNHIFEENTLPEGINTLKLYNYTEDINQCIFRKSLSILFLDNYNIKITDKFFENNPNLCYLYITNITEDNVNFNLYTFSKCHVNINGLIRSKNLYKYINIFQCLNTDNNKPPNKIPNMDIIEKNINLINKIIMT